MAPAAVEAKPQASPITRGTPERPIVRFNDPTSAPPNVPWGKLGLRLHSSPWVRWPTNVPEHHRGAWVINCPCRFKTCPGFVEIIEVDCGSRSDWTPARGCSRGCRAVDVAEALVGLIGGSVDGYLPPVLFDEYEAEELKRFIRSSPAVRAAWRGTGKFRSLKSQVVALGHRLREAGAPLLFADMCVAVLAERLGVIVWVPVRVADYERWPEGDVEC